MPSKTTTSDVSFVGPKSSSITSDVSFSVFATQKIQSDVSFAPNKPTLTLVSDVAFAVMQQLPTGEPSPQPVCPNVLKSCLPCLDDPTSNYSSEDPDLVIFCATATYRVTNPPLGECGGIGGQDLACTQFCCSDISQTDAQLCALRKAQECVLGGEP